MEARKPFTSGIGNNDGLFSLLPGVLLICCCCQTCSLSSIHPLSGEVSLSILSQHYCPEVENSIRPMDPGFWGGNIFGIWSISCNSEFAEFARLACILIICKTCNISLHLMQVIPKYWNVSDHILYQNMANVYITLGRNSLFKIHLLFKWYPRGPSTRLEYTSLFFCFYSSYVDSLIKFKIKYSYKSRYIFPSIQLPWQPLL